MDRTVSCEIAKKLQEAGWNKECYFLSPKDSEELMHFSRGKTYGPEELYWRPMLHEILEELPDEIEVKSDDWGRYLTFKKDEDGYSISYEIYDYSLGYNFSKNPHDCAALLWIWCKENGYLSDKK